MVGKLLFVSSLSTEFEPSRNACILGYATGVCKHVKRFNDVSGD